MNINDFVSKWSKSSLKETAAAHSFFDDLCQIVGHPTPTECDPNGEFFTYEKHVQKISGGKGFADVWFKGKFAWENKGKHKNLEEAYRQLLEYREDLENPPLLVVCDFETLEIHTNFVNTPKQKYIIHLSNISENLPLLKALFFTPELLKPNSPEFQDLATNYQIEIADNDTILILLSDFNNESHVNYDVRSSIQAALQSALIRHELPEVRLEYISRVFRRSELNSVKQIGISYNATIFIWGHYDDGGMFPRFTILKDQIMNIMPEGPQDYLVNLARPPDDFTFFVNRDLPERMSYFTQFTIGLIYYHKQVYQKALSLLEAAANSVKENKTVSMHQSLASLYFYQGNIFYQIKDYPQAIQRYSETIKLSPDNFLLYAAYVNRGSAYAGSNSMAMAFIDCNKAIEIIPDKPIAYYNRGKAYIEFKQFSKAINDFSKGIELDPYNTEGYHNRAIAYSNYNDLEKALSDFTTIIELDNTNVVAYSNRAVTFADLGNFEQAISDCVKAIELKPDYAVAYNNLGYVCRKCGNLEEAITSCSKAIDLAPHQSFSYNNRGLAYRDAGHLEDALSDFTKAIDIEPDHRELSVLYTSRGLVYGDLGDKEKAYYDFSKAIELDPENSSAYANRALVTPEPEEAFLDCTKAIELGVDNSSIRASRGVAGLATGNLEQAIVDFTKFLELIPELEPNHAFLCISRGNAQAMLGNFEKAIADFNTAIELNSDYSSAAYLLRGRAKTSTGNLEQAILDFSEALKLGIKDTASIVAFNGSEATMYFNRGNAYADLTDFEQAILDLNKALELDPTFIAAHMNLGRVYVMLEKFLILDNEK